MSLQDAASARGVNPHNGSSIDAVQASTFQSLWDKGAFEPGATQVTADPPRPGQQPQRQEPRQQQEPRQAPHQTQQPEPQQAIQQESDAQVTEPEIQAPAGTEEGPEYANLDDYLTKSQIDPESFRQMPVTVKVDGKTSQIPLADLIRSYQTDAHVTQKSQAFADQQRQWEAQKQTVTQSLQTHLQTVTNLVTLAHQELLRDYQGIDWNKLQTEDPIRWSVLNAQFQQRNGKIQQAMQQTAAQYRAQQESQAQELAQRLPQEQEAMFTAVPQWRDDAKFKADRAEMQAMAQKMGFTQAELSQIYDHRYMLALHYASQFLKLQAQSPQTLKKVRAAPQMASPGARITRDPNAVARTQAKERFLKNRRDPDAQAAYFETLA
jgi:hypothetical protein